MSDCGPITINEWRTAFASLPEPTLEDLAAYVAWRKGEISGAEYEAMRKANATGAKLPSDMDACAELHGAACGHFALAAALGKEVREVLEFFPQLLETGKCWCSTVTMEMAFKLAAVRFEQMGLGFWPRHGAVLIQGEGSWMQAGVPYAAQLARTHWVAVRPGEHSARMVADCNHDTAWLRIDRWEELILAPILAKWKATGWRIKRAYELKA